MSRRTIKRSKSPTGIEKISQAATRAMQAEALPALAQQLMALARLAIVLDDGLTELRGALVADKRAAGFDVEEAEQTLLVAGQHLGQAQSGLWQAALATLKNLATQQQRPSVEFIFEVDPENPFRPYPKVPASHLIVDGVRYLSLAQTAQRFGRTPDQWRQEWLASFGGAVAR